MAIVEMRELLEAGVHFGHRAKRWHPKMGGYIFTERNGIHTRRDITAFVYGCDRDGVDLDNLEAAIWMVLCREGVLRE